MADYNKAFKNLNKYDKEIQKLVLKLYNSVNDTLKELIPDNSINLQEAQRKLMIEYNKALESTDFVNAFKTGTVKVITESSYVKSSLGGTKQKWADYLWQKSLFPDKIKLSTRIRNNSINIVRDQRKILNTALREGRSIAKIVGNIGDDTLQGFTRELPKYIDDLRKSSIAGQKLTQKQIIAVRKQASKIKTAGLRADYERLIKAIDLGGNVDKAVYFAMERLTKYYANRVARSETIRTLSVEETHKQLDNPDTHYVKNVTQGNNPCPFCIATENLGFVPVENATISTHHTNCSCRPIFKRSIKKPKKWSNETFMSRQQTEINKLNAKAEKEGRPKTYIEPYAPTNLRSTDPLKDWEEFKSD